MAAKLSDTSPFKYDESAPAGWQYFGDMNVENGGFWFKESGYDDHVYYAELICHDNFGSAENEFTLYVGSIYIDQKDVERVKAEWLQQAYVDRSRYDFISDVFAHGGGDVDRTTVLRVGKDKRSSTDCSGREVDEILNWNIKLRRYIENEFLDR